MKNPAQIPVVVVAGPTASGKTEVGIQICRWFNGEVVSADSMQIYQHLSIGTAKPSMEERQGIPHHLMDILSPEQAFSVADYVKQAHDIIAQIHHRGRLPVIVGGTGLYIDSLINNIQFSKTVSNPKRREELHKRAEREGNVSLWEYLFQLDPQAAQSIHPNNVGRVIRAIEMIEEAGKTKTEQINESRSEPSPYQVCYIALNYRDREKLYARINQRVLNMLDDGLEEEARWILEHGYAPTASQAIGYKEMFDYLRGEECLEQAIEKIQTGSRHYAKRQLTWFRRNPEIQWFYPDEYKNNRDLMENIKKYLSTFLKM